jgi:hypothetical protein
MLIDMKKTTFNRYSLLLVLLFQQGFSFAQHQINPYENRIIMKHYGSDKMKYLESHDIAKYNQIINYYTGSFNVENPDCSTCPVDYAHFFNIRLFDISEYEHLRLENDSYAFTDSKTGLKVTMLSQTDLDNLQNPSRTNQALPALTVFPGNFPKITDYELSHAGFELYKNAIYQWAKIYPDLYHQITNSSSVIKISFSEFLVFSEMKRQEILNQSLGYIIID